MGFVAEPFAMIGLGKTFLILAGTAEVLAGLCLLFPRSGVVGALLLATVMVGTMGAASATRSAAPAPSSPRCRRPSVPPCRAT
jgi:uncharacterized membrane protein YphA (DoxX/SURF4 family)